MYPICFYVFEYATLPHILLSYATSERLGIVSFQVLNLAATASIDHVALPPSPGGQRKTTKQVTFVDHIMEKVESITSSDAPPYQLPWQEEDHFPQGWRLTPSLSRTKGNSGLTSGLSRTIDTSKEVKVGKINHFKTLNPALVPNSPSSKTIRHSTLANGPKAYSPLQRGTVTPGDFPSCHSSGLGHYSIEKSLSWLFWHYR